MPVKNPALRDANHYGKKMLIIGFVQVFMGNYIKKNVFKAGKQCTEKTCQIKVLPLLIRIICFNFAGIITDIKSDSK
jgi:hypothetical protein